MSRQANQGNGPSKDQLNDHEDFSIWRNQSIQNSYVSGVAPSNSADPYLSSYYGGAQALGPYQHSGPWTSSHQEMPPVAAAPGFLGYGGVQHQQQHHDSYGIDGMFSGPAPATGFGVLHHHQQQGNYGGYEYSTWESRKQQQNLPVPHYEDYYHPPVYQAPAPAPATGFRNGASVGDSPSNPGASIGPLIHGKKLSYNKDKQIAEGSRGIFVFEGLFIGILSVAIKRFQRSSVVDESTVKQEAELMLKASDHPNILRYFGYEMISDYLLLATELCIGTLQHLIEGTLLQQGPLILEDEKEILLQVTRGVAHLHSDHIKIIHRDIKPTNLLVYYTPSVGNSMKVADFGISKILKAEQKDATNSNMTNPKGTRGWMAPEQYNASRIGFEVDIFSLGCVFGYTLSKGKHPFGEDIEDRIYFVKRGKPMTLTNDDLKERYSVDGLSFRLIQSMLNMNPVNRPTALDVLGHDFFQL